MADVGRVEERDGELPFHKLNDRLILCRSHLRSTTCNVLFAGPRCLGAKSKAKSDKEKMRAEILNYYSPKAS